MKLLNLDDIAPQIEKSIKLKGETYSMRTPTLKDFAQDAIFIRDVNAKLMSPDLAEEDKMALFVEFSTLAVSRAFPEMPHDVLSQLTVEQLTAIKTFIDEQVEEAGENAEDEQGNV